MLSYRHAFHAGNFADVLKHFTQISVLHYLKKKNKPFSIIDTHAGAGAYPLADDYCQKLKEYESGYTKLSTDLCPTIAQYLTDIERVQTHLKQKQLTEDHNCYPGSPLLSAINLREYDQAFFYELHPADIDTLKDFTRDFPNVTVKQEDGYQGLLATLPPRSRRGLVLIDPPYELKTDYEKAVTTLIKAHKKFATGIYILWYPVVERARIETMAKQLADSGIRKIDQYELGISADTEARGMTSSGVFVINPPWGLRESMSETLPTLANALTSDGKPHFTINEVAPE